MPNLGFARHKKGDVGGSGANAEQLRQGPVPPAVASLSRPIHTFALASIRVFALAFRYPFFYPSVLEVGAETETHRGLYLGPSEPLWPIARVERGYFSDSITASTKITKHEMRNPGDVPKKIVFKLY